MIDFDKLKTINTSIDHIFHGKIMECDMREASLQIAEKFNLLSREELENLKVLPKEQRVVQVGCIQRDHPEFTEAYYSKLKEIRKHFIEVNKLTDDNIIALHSDALFVNTKRKLKLVIDGIEFRIKGQWTSFMRFDNLEFFYDDDNEEMTYKNVPDSLLKLHTIGLCKHILTVFKMIENNDERIFDYLSDFQSRYLKGELSSNYYIPFAKINGVPLQDNLKLLSFLCLMAIKEC